MGIFWSKIEKIHNEINELEHKIEELEQQIETDEKRIKVAGKTPGLESQIRLGDMYKELYELKESLRAKRRFI